MEPFEYPECKEASYIPAWSGWGEDPDADGVERGSSSPAGAPGQAAGQPAEVAALVHQLAEERQRAFEAGRSQGREEGRRLAGAEHAAADREAQEQRRRHAAELMRGFAEAQEHYLRAVEEEVVRLALAVAARILRREAQADPLLLLGAVRVALGQVAAASEVRVRVPEADLQLWSEALTLLPNPSVKTVVVAGEGMRLGDCVVETSLGAADLGVRSQLNEIERGWLENGEASGEHLPADTQVVSVETS